MQDYWPTILFKTLKLLLTKSTKSVEGVGGVGHSSAEDTLSRDCTDADLLAT